MSKLLFSLSILSGLTSFSLYNIGFALEKKAIQKLPEDKKEKTLILLKTILKNPLWLLGLFLTIISVGFYFVALLWAPFSAIAPLGGFGLIILVIYAHIDLKESFKKLEIISFFLILIGIITSSYLTSLEIISYSWNQWIDFAHSLSGLLFLGLSILISIILIIIPILRKSKMTFYNIALFAGIIAGIQTILIKGITVWASAGIWNEDLYVIIIYILAMLLTALISTGSLQFAFKEGRVSIIMAVYNGITTLFPIIFGGILLNEWEHMITRNKILLGFAIFLTLAGIVILSLKHTPDFMKEDE
jgi:hypothetical protein